MITTTHRVAAHLQDVVDRLKAGSDAPMPSEDIVRLEDEIGNVLATLCEQRQREEEAEERKSGYGWGI